MPVAVAPVSLPMASRVVVSGKGLLVSATVLLNAPNLVTTMRAMVTVKVSIPATPPEKWRASLYP